MLLPFLEVWYDSAGLTRQRILAFLNLKVRPEFLLRVSRCANLPGIYEELELMVALSKIAVVCTYTKKIFSKCKAILDGLS